MRKELFSFPKLMAFLLLILCGFLVYMFVLQPIIAWAWLSPVEHNGIDLYTNNTYLEYEKGTEFRDTIHGLSFTQACTIVDFSYFDTFWRDNLFYGKMCDTYVLDLQASENYLEIKEEVIKLSKHNNEIDRYTLYLLTEPESSSDWVIVGLNDTKQAVRCMMITEMKSSNIYGFSRILIRQTDLNWE